MNRKQKVKYNFITLKHQLENNNTTQTKIRVNDICNIEPLAWQSTIRLARMKSLPKYLS